MPSDRTTLSLRVQASIGAGPATASRNAAYGYASQFLAGSVHSGFYFPDLPHLTSNSAFSLFTWTGDVISICSQPL